MPQAMTITLRAALLLLLIWPFLVTALVREKPAAPLAQSGGVHAATLENNSALVAAQAPQRHAGTERVVVQKVIDGDTVLLKGLGKLRLLGIDTPELAHGKGEDEPFALHARKRVSALLQRHGATLETEKGTSGNGRDAYGRLLGYLRLGNGEDLGEVLLAEGLAAVYHYTPPAARVAHYLTVESNARRSRRGIWSGQGGRVIDQSEARHHLKKYRLVQGTLSTIARNRHGGVTITFAGNRHRRMALFIYRPEWQRHFASDHTFYAWRKRFLGQRVEVRGRIHSSNGPYIRVRHPGQLTLLSQR